MSLRAAAIATLILTASVLPFLRPPDAGAQPEVTLIFPEDGSVLAEPPPVIQICFASPVNIRDLDKGGDFRFAVLRPNGSGLGLRIVFQNDGFGVGIHPGLPEDPPQGEWTFEWRVTDPDSLEPTEGTVHFTVRPDGSPVSQDPPPRCPSDGSPTAPGPTQTSAPPPTASPTPAAGEGETDDQDILLPALIATGGVLAVAVAGLVLYVVRRRTGRLHHPPGDQGPEEGEQR
jgi:methionine-rich copper-binding protein CopC